MPSTELWPLGFVGPVLVLVAGLAGPAVGMSEAGRPVAEEQRLEAVEADSLFESGKLIEPKAFGGKMLDAAAPGTEGAGGVNDPQQPSAQGRGSEVEQPGGRARRILWRQIQ